jgi:hypothetical protein
LNEAEAADAALIGALFVPALTFVGMHKTFPDVRTSLLGMTVLAFAFWLVSKGIGFSAQIRPVEQIGWSLENGKSLLRTGLLTGAAIGMIIGLLLAVVYALGENSGYRGQYSHIRYFIGFVVIVFLCAAIIPALVGAVLGMAMTISFGGFYTGVIETRVRPNQEIWRPARTAAISLFIGLFLVWVSAVNHPPHVWLFTPFGIIIGLVLVLRMGGLAFLQHWSLRLILLARGYTPRDYVNFLKYASDLVLLHRAGGGFAFAHRLFLDQFASMGDRFLDTQKK